MLIFDCHLKWNSPFIYETKKISISKSIETHDRLVNDTITILPAQVFGYCLYPICLYSNAYIWPIYLHSYMCFQYIFLHFAVDFWWMKIVSIQSSYLLMIIILMQSTLRWYILQCDQSVLIFYSVEIPSFISEM